MVVALFLLYATAVVFKMSQAQRKAAVQAPGAVDRKLLHQMLTGRLQSRTRVVFGKGELYDERVIRIHLTSKPKRPIVDGLAKNAQVIGVHHAMCKPYPLPLRQGNSSPAGNLSKPGCVLVLTEIHPRLGRSICCRQSLEDYHVLLHSGRVDLERTKPQGRRRNTADRSSPGQ